MSKYIVTVVAIIGIVILEGIAVYKGMNGVSLAAAVGAIAGLGGFTIGKILKTGG